MMVARVPAPVSLKTAVGRSLSILEQMTGATAGAGGRGVTLTNRFRDALRQCLGVLDLRPYRLDDDVRLPTKRESEGKHRTKVSNVTDVAKIRMRLHAYCNVIVDHIAPGRDRPEIETELRSIIDQACAS